MSKSIIEIEQMAKGSTYHVEVYQNQGINLDYPMHYHAHAFELVLHEGCRGTRIVGDHLAEFGKQDFVLMAPGLPHCWYGKGDYKDAETRITVLQFSDRFLQAEILRRPEFLAIKKLLNRARRGILFDAQVIERLRPLLLRLEDQPSMQQYITILSILHELSVSTEARPLCSAAYSFRGEQDEHAKFQKVHGYIVANYRQKIRLEEVASLINLSPSAFSHYFKKRTFKSFSQFVNELRISFACRTLIETERTIAEIAYESGFNNLSNFNRIFKKFRQMTPKEFRKRVQLERSHDRVMTADRSSADISVN